MPCSFTGPKMFCAGPIFLCQTKNLFTFCARQKDDLHSVKLVFVPAVQSQKFWAGSKHLDRHKTFWDLYKDKA